MRAVLHIDRALKRLYNLDSDHRAERFLILKEPATVSVRNARAAVKGHTGTLYIQKMRDDLSVGIYLSESVRRELADFSSWNGKWNLARTSAFSVAAEEVSHFHYLLQNAGGGRPVSQFELEFQGEVDKFLLTYYARLKSGEDGVAVFHELFEQFFYQYSLHRRLTAHERTRYQDASNFARSFVWQLEPHLSRGALSERLLRLVRRFYRVNTTDKISLSLRG